VQSIEVHGKVFRVIIQLCGDLTVGICYQLIEEVLSLLVLLGGCSWRR
jgi:hypothetical protein